MATYKCTACGTEVIRDLRVKAYRSTRRNVKFRTYCGKKMRNVFMMRK